jgi:hypothetical protein
MMSRGRKAAVAPRSGRALTLRGLPMVGGRGRTQWHHRLTDAFTMILYGIPITGLLVAGAGGPRGNRFVRSQPDFGTGTDFGRRTRWLSSTC